MNNKLLLFFRTIYYLKSEQLFYQLYYFLRTRFRKFVNYKHIFTLYRKGVPLKFDEFIPAKTSYVSNKFTFLNQSVKFSDMIDWEYPDKGKLWTNHLNYFDYLMQEDMSKARGSALMYLLIDHLPKSVTAKQAYSISVRGINWVKFISMHNITRKTIDRFLYCQYRILIDNIAYDKLGNHLLENGCSMLFGAYYFKGYELLNEAKIILTKELYEQILADGAHFQLSPMYHQLMLARILDCYNLMKNNDVYQDEQLQELLLTSAEKMLGWLEQMTYSNGMVPCVNDSTYDVAPTTAELFAYAERLGIKKEVIPLGKSGYRMFRRNNIEVLVDVGNIGPYCQTIHSHSDTFNFEVVDQGKPIVVDTGVSTYASNNIRLKERQTFSHNTVRFAGKEQSEMYGSFRVGARATTKVMEEEDGYIKACHDGYKKHGVHHERAFTMFENGLQINDQLVHDLDELPSSSAFIHFHPDCRVKLNEADRVSVDNWSISFAGHFDIKVLDYNFAKGFNKITKAKMVQVSFKDKLETVLQRV